MERERRRERRTLRDTFCIWDADLLDMKSLIESSAYNSTKAEDELAEMF